MKREATRTLFQVLRSTKLLHLRRRSTATTKRTLLPKSLREEAQQRTPATRRRILLPKLLHLRRRRRGRLQTNPATRRLQTKARRRSPATTRGRILLPKLLHLRRRGRLMTTARAATRSLKPPWRLMAGDKKCCLNRICHLKKDGVERREKIWNEKDWLLPRFLFRRRKGLWKGKDRNVWRQRRQSHYRLKNGGYWNIVEWTKRRGKLSIATLQKSSATVQRSLKNTMPPFITVTFVTVIGHGKKG